MRKLSKIELVTVQKLLKAINSMQGGKLVRLMEVCGTHTMAIFHLGIRQLLPKWIDIVSGPGCPVCVTPNKFIDTAIAYARLDNVIITTFGDMMRVPGSRSSLNIERINGSDIRIVYSPLDSLKIAEANHDKKVIFLGVGFETTAPGVAATVIAAERSKITNFYVLSAHKLVPPALRFLLDNPNTNIDGFLLPGHVCLVTGKEEFNFISEEYKVPGVIAGFEPLQILKAIYHLVKLVNESKTKILNDYQEVVSLTGNIAAQQFLKQVYDVTGSQWRGLGRLPQSGLEFTDRYQKFSAEKMIDVLVDKTIEPLNCLCGEILQGAAKPTDCKLFSRICTPQHPVGSCMVSTEGTCAAWYKYGKVRINYGNQANLSWAR